jgi:hypothetical protein
MRTRWLSLAVSLALVAGTALAQGNGSPPCANIQVVSHEEGSNAADRFSATATTDLVFNVNFHQSFSGDHLLELRLFTPSGHLYQSLAVPIADASRVPGSRMVPGYPRPLKEQTPAEVTEGTTRLKRVEVRFPVGGTLISSNSLYGRWRVEAYVDGAGQPCSPPKAFVIQQ